MLRDPSSEQSALAEAGGRRDEGEPASQPFFELLIQARAWHEGGTCRGDGELGQKERISLWSTGRALPHVAISRLGTLRSGDRSTPESGITRTRIGRRARRDLVAVPSQRRRDVVQADEGEILRFT